MVRRPTVFAYVEQARGVRELLKDFTSGPLDVIVVDNNGLVLASHQYGVFVNITTHVRQPPAALWERVRVRGFTIWTIDDTYLRNRMRGLLDEPGDLTGEA